MGTGWMETCQRRHRLPMRWATLGFSLHTGHDRNAVSESKAHCSLVYRGIKNPQRAEQGGSLHL